MANINYLIIHENRQTGLGNVKTRQNSHIETNQTELCVDSMAESTTMLVPK